MRILVVDDSAEMREAVTFVLKKYFKAEIVEVTSGNKAIEFLKKDQKLDCVVCDYNMPDGNGGSVFSFMRAAVPTLPYILCSSDRPDEHQEFVEASGAVPFVQKPNISSPLVDHIRRLLAPEELRSDSDFTALPIQVFLKINTIPCDVFIRLSSKKHVRLVNRGDALMREQYSGYVSKGVNELFILDQDFDTFLQTYVKDALAMDLVVKETPIAKIRALIASLKDKTLVDEAQGVLDRIEAAEATPLSAEGIVLLTADAHKSVQKMLQKFGMTRETSAFVGASVKAAMQAIFVNPNIKDMMSDFLKRSKENYIAHHSVLLANVSAWMATEIGWNSELTRYKLAMAAFLHDVLLPEDRLAKIQSIADLTKVKGTEDYKVVEDHAIKAAQMAASNATFPSDVDTIIRQHHETQDGTGFPGHLTFEQIPALSALFILSHAMVDFVLVREGNPWSVEDYVRYARQTYTKGIFKKILDELEVKVHGTGAKP